MSHDAVNRIIVVDIAYIWWRHCKRTPFCCWCRMSSSSTV